MNCFFTKISIISIIITATCLSAPVGIFMHAYSPEAPPEKIECFEFERSIIDDKGTWLYLANGRPVLFTKYRNRGTILYATGVKPGHPDFDKYLKLYEETATKIPSTRPFLNPRILAMRNLVIEDKKRSDAISKLPTITLADGKQLRGCIMTKIEKDTVFLKHQDGFKKVDKNELDSAERILLNATCQNWSLEDPFISTVSSSGTFEKIVFKNGLLLRNARFKSVENKNLVFVTGDDSISIPITDFPGEFSVLGDEAVKSLAQLKLEPTNNATPENSSKEHVSETTGNFQKNVLQPWGEITDAESLVRNKNQEEREHKRLRTEKLEEEQNMLIRENQKVIEKADIDLQVFDAVIVARAKFFVERQLEQKDFPNLCKAKEFLYQVTFRGDNSPSILITSETKFDSDGNAQLSVRRQNQISAKMNNGFEKKIAVFREVPQFEVDLYNKVVEEKYAAQKIIREIELSREEQKNIDESIAYARKEFERKVGLPVIFLSEKLRARGIRARVASPKFNELLSLLRQDDIPGALRFIRPKPHSNTLDWGAPRNSSEVDSRISILANEHWDIPVVLESEGVNAFNDGHLITNTTTGIHSVVALASFPINGKSIFSLANEGDIKYNPPILDSIDSPHPNGNGVIYNGNTARDALYFFESTAVYSQDSAFQQMKSFFEHIEEDIQKYNERFELGEISKSEIQNLIIELDNKVKNKCNNWLLHKF